MCVNKSAYALLGIRAKNSKAKWEKVLAAQCVPLQGISQSTGFQTEDVSTSEGLENQAMQLTKNQLGDVIGGPSNPGGGSGLTTTSQTSGAGSQDEDTSPILDDTFEGSGDNTDTMPADEDVSQVLDGTLGGLSDTSDASTTDADNSGTTTTTDDDDINQSPGDTFGATEGDLAATSSTNNDQPTVSTDDDLNQALDDTLGISQNDPNPASTSEGDQIATATDEDVNQGLDDTFGTPEDEQTATSTTGSDQTMAMAIDDGQLASSPEEVIPTDFTAENVDTDPSSVPEDEINSALV